jgi:DNA polymerase-3 subunit delta'
MQFKQIVGQHAVKQRLINSVNENRVSHAQLFLGPEGSGSLRLLLLMPNIYRAKISRPMIRAGYARPAASIKN